MLFFKLSFSILLLVTCSSPEVTTRSPRENRESAVSIREMELEIVRLVNEYRRANGRSTLRAAAAMQREAERHSANMARGKIPLSHQGFADRISRIREQTGVKGRSGENVAEGYKTAKEVVQAWIKSPGHRKHLLGDYDLTGVGIARSRNGKLYFTQLFIAITNR